MAKPWNLPWTKPRDFAMFKANRTDGSISIFRCASCVACKQLIPKSFTYCSESCHTAKLNSQWDRIGETMKWNCNIESLKAGKHEVETIEGAVRRGRITKINERSMVIDGQTISWPVSIEMNHESSDFISFDQIKRIDAIKDQ